MSEVNIIELSNEFKYSACVVLQTHLSLHEIKPVLEHQLTELQGKIVLDTLFHSGNVEDRFIEVEIKNGQINWSTVKVASIGKHNEIRSLVARHIKDNLELINSSILSSIQKKLISKGIGI